MQAVHNDAFRSSLLRSSRLRGGTVAAIAGSILQDELPLARRRVNSDDSCARPHSHRRDHHCSNQSRQGPAFNPIHVDQHTACGISKGALQTSHAIAGIHRVPAETSLMHLSTASVAENCQPTLVAARTDVSLATEEFIAAQHWVNDQWQNALHSEVREGLTSCDQRQKGL